MADRLSSDVRVGPVLTRQMLEKTLPWKIKVQVLNMAGELILEWDPQTTVHIWDDVAHFTFGPKDVYFEDPL